MHFCFVGVGCFGLCLCLKYACISVCIQALVNEWDEQERRTREKEQKEASLYRSRSKLHGGGLSEEQQEERDFRRSFPTYHKVSNTYNPSVHHNPALYLCSLSMFLH